MRLCPRCRATFEASERFCPRDASPLVDQVDFDRIGTTVGNYKLLSIVGRGGMGTVYHGEHVYIGKPVAVKVLHERYARYEDAIKRFLREARAASSINHPNIVDVTDFGPAGTSVFFVMEFLQGQSLEDLLEKEAPLALHRAINIVNQLASALAAAHEKQIVHRDLKPENVMLTKRPGRRDLIVSQGDGRFVVEKEEDYDFVKILDFGIAKVHEPDTVGNGRQTMAGTIFGTPEYMSPEAARGVAVDHRADIYSLGIIFYDMVTGRVPFQAEAPIDIIGHHISTLPTPPSQIAPHAEITPAAERLIMRTLAKDPNDRPQTMDDLRAELQGCYGSVAYRRDAYRIPGARESGVIPRQARLTEELDDWLREHQDALATMHKRLEQIAAAPPEAGNAEDMWAMASSPPVAGAPEEPAKPKSSEPVLLTQRKPNT
jgi:eukaryotic-like serine/threonine-protein kinase